ncbi:SET domain-containing protein [Deminuibacter soli]|uniref:SET domain-containing protein n=1 Tax=Deminuibacter soli TaxID=2291815 RepID=UPI001B87BEAC|nr:SET domain-containing protein-lysine N-methyltransferase [Deminuibacter soli]
MIRYQLKTGKSRIDGTGCFMLEAVPARRKIGNMEGEIISVRVARKRAAASKRIAIVEFGDGRALDAGNFATPLKFINHSCDPNTYLRVAYGQVEFYSLRKIKKGEELTCNYGPTHHDGRLPCQCGAKNCKGYL